MRNPPLNVFSGKKRTVNNFVLFYILKSLGMWLYVWIIVDIVFSLQKKTYTISHD